MKQNMVECLSGFSALWYNKIDQKINTIDSCTENEIVAKIFMVKVKGSWSFTALLHGNQISWRYGHRIFYSTSVEDYDWPA